MHHKIHMAALLQVVLPYYFKQTVCYLPDMSRPHLVCIWGTVIVLQIFNLDFHHVSCWRTWQNSLITNMMLIFLFSLNDPPLLCISTTVLCIDQGNNYILYSYITNYIACSCSKLKTSLGSYTVQSHYLVHTTHVTSFCAT